MDGKQIYTKKTVFLQARMTGAFKMILPDNCPICEPEA